MNKRQFLFLWMVLLLVIPNPLAANLKSASNWVVEDTSGKLQSLITELNGVVDIVAPGGASIWYNEKLSGDYEISYSIQVVMENGQYDRLSDMNCFWGAKDPFNPHDFFARSKSRKGQFKNYDALNLFYVGKGGNNNTTTRFREYHGEFYNKDKSKVKPLIAEYTDPEHLLQPNRWYEISIRSSRGVTSYRCDGKEYFRHSVRPGQTDGYFGLRLWKNHVRVTNFVVRKTDQEFAFTNYRRYFSERMQGASEDKIKAIGQLRKDFHENGYRLPHAKSSYSVDELLDLLKDDGVFADLDSLERQYISDGTYSRGYATTPMDKVGILIAKALERVFWIGEAYRKGEMPIEKSFSDKVQKAIIHYGDLEIKRSNKLSRFHASCFAIPSAATNIYFTYLQQMDEVEQTSVPSLTKDVSDMLKVLGLQAFTQPLRNDSTDDNVVSIERFRNHVWWVGGNALAYRPLLQVAVMYSSVPMIDLLAKICQKGISMTSHATYHDSFWTEGFTADGAGWGHGKQCLIWGYPIDGTFSALTMLGRLKGTPWAQKLAPDNVTALLNFLHGGNWYYYKGYRLPVLDRNSHRYNPTELAIPYHKMLKLLIEDWPSSFTTLQLTELRQLDKEVEQHRINMFGYEPGIYNGVRWFFNNDDLIKKNEDYHITINMASRRCDGLESADFADNYNFCSTDGTTLFQRKGDEYYQILGGWDVLSLPGTTSREGMEHLKPVTNWRGYCSKSNYAVGVTDGSQNAVAGYIFDKMDASTKNRKGGGKKNAVLYNVKAYKGYFIIDDYFIALGAGVTNMSPEIEGNIHTTFDQTAWVDSVYLWDGDVKRYLSEGQRVLKVKKRNNPWIIQKDKFAYRALPTYSKSVSVALETKPTHWVKMNPSNAGIKGLSKEIKSLRIWTDHGKRAENDTYGYVVYTGKGMPASKLPFEVLRNDSLVQAVRSLDDSLIQAVFYSDHSLLKAKGIRLSVSAPCALMIQENQNEYRVTVNDALLVNNLDNIELEFNGRNLSVSLPQGMYAGKGTTILFPKK